LEALWINLATILAVFDIRKGVGKDGVVDEPVAEFTSGFLRYVADIELLHAVPTVLLVTQNHIIVFLCQRHGQWKTPSDPQRWMRSTSRSYREWQYSPAFQPAQFWCFLCLMLVYPCEIYDLLRTLSTITPMPFTGKNTQKSTRYADVFRQV
jgi:hypothetical protein